VAGIFVTCMGWREAFWFSQGKTCIELTQPRVVLGSLAYGNCERCDSRNKINR